MRKFLIINPFGIGDVLFTTPVIRAIKENYPDSLVGYWCNVRVKDVFKTNPYVDRIFALSRGDLKKLYKKSFFEGSRKFVSLLFELGKGKFDTAFDFSLDHRYGLTAKLLGIRKRIGFNYRNRGRFLTDKIDIEGYADKHVVEYYLGLLDFVRIKSNKKNLDLFVSDAGREKAKDFLCRHNIEEGDLIIGIAPGAGASWGVEASFKHWPVESFAELSHRLIDKLGARVLILGDESEIYISQKMLDTLGSRVVDLVGKTSLSELIGIINGLDILITNDGGPLHIAVALGIKTVSIFGPVDEIVYGPYPLSDKHIVMKSSLDCRPCYQKFRLPRCVKERECITSITVEEVFDAVRRQV